MILVTTAGKVGAEAARLLAEQSVPVRLIVRDRDKAAASVEAGVDVVEGDLGVPASIDAALKGVDGVILVSPAVPELELNVIAAAARADVGHVVKITSKASADSVIGRRRDQAAIEDGLIASGLDYTLMRNNGYMQNLLMLAPMIAATGGFGTSAGDGRVGMIDTRDVAAVVAAIAASPAGHVGQTYWPTGPELISFPDAARILSEVLGRPIAYQPLTFEEEMQGMIAAGLPEALAEMNARAVNMVADGDSDWITEDVPTILGRPGRTFTEFADDHREAFG
jgi:uncharacterized protein YbjT (DUF2867 family)